MLKIKTKAGLLGLVLRAIPDTGEYAESEDMIEPSAVNFTWTGCGYRIDMDLNVMTSDRAHQSGVEALLEVLIRQRAIMEGLLGKERESTVF